MSGRRRESGEMWQSYADLAMGLMAMLTLILLMLLAVQQKTNAELEAEKGRTEEELRAIRAERVQLEAARGLLESERQGFALELMELFEATYELVAQQDAAETWISELFKDEACRLALGAGGALEILDAEGQQRTNANLYQSGATALSEAGRQAIDSCRQSFMRLAYCLSPLEAATLSPEVTEARQRGCLGSRVLQGDVVARLREGVEALVLEGSTDRYPYGATPNIVAGANRVVLSQKGDSFVGNAYLGAERARQALGFLISLVQNQDSDRYDALEVLLSRVAIESSSFGRFQVGPTEWRAPGCGDADACDAARNLSLRIRWRKSELRKPVETIRERVCRLVRDPESALVRGLTSAKVDLASLLQRLGCPSKAPEKTR